MPGKATMMTELRISIKSDIGVMAKLTLPLKQNSINIECFCAYEMDDKAIFYLMTNNNPKAKAILTNAGYTVTENPVVLWTIDNTPGEVHRATAALAEAKVNINYIYSTTVSAGKTASVVFATSDNNKTFDTLNRL